jgi:hypothetical protein
VVHHSLLEHGELAEISPVRTRKESSGINSTSGASAPGCQRVAMSAPGQNDARNSGHARRLNRS